MRDCFCFAMPVLYFVSFVMSSGKLRNSAFEAFGVTLGRFEPVIQMVAQDLHGPHAFTEHANGHGKLPAPNCSFDGDPVLAENLRQTFFADYCVRRQVAKLPDDPLVAVRVFLCLNVHLLYSSLLSVPEPVFRFPSSCSQFDPHCLASMLLLSGVALQEVAGGVPKNEGARAFAWIGLATSIRIRRHGLVALRS
jgi:hypothetical protein